MGSNEVPTESDVRKRMDPALRDLLAATRDATSLDLYVHFSVRHPKSGP